MRASAVLCQIAKAILLQKCTHVERHNQVYLYFIHLALLISILITLKLNSHPDVIIQGVPRDPRLLIRLAVVGDEAAYIFEVGELIVANGT